MPRTRYVSTPEHARDLMAALRSPDFSDIRALTVTFLSDPAVIAELLPPPLEPAAEPRATVTVAAIGRSNCVGPFDGASINLACRYRGEDGFYCLTMPMSTDTAVIFGRELYAEPKKLAAISLEVGQRHGAGNGHPPRRHLHRDRREVRRAAAARRRRVDHQALLLQVPAAG